MDVKDMFRPRLTKREARFIAETLKVYAQLMRQKQEEMEHRERRIRQLSAARAVGITLKPKLLAETRKHNLNISRITEQALTSILEYLALENESKSSKSLNACSLLREKI